MSLPSTSETQQAASEPAWAPPALAPQTMRRDYRLGVANGVLFTLGDSLTSANLVLALLVRQLGGSLALVGLLPALQAGDFLLPQLLVGGRLQAMPYKLRLYRRAAVVRLSTFLILLSSGGHPARRRGCVVGANCGVSCARSVRSSQAATSAGSA